MSEGEKDDRENSCELRRKKGSSPIGHPVSRSFYRVIACDNSMTRSVFLHLQYSSGTIVYVYSYLI